MAPISEAKSWFVVILVSQDFLRLENMALPRMEYSAVFCWKTRTSCFNVHPPPPAQKGNMRYSCPCQGATLICHDYYLSDKPLSSQGPVQQKVPWGASPVPKLFCNRTIPFYRELLMQVSVSLPGTTCFQFSYTIHFHSAFCSWHKIFIFSIIMYLRTLSAVFLCKCLVYLLLSHLHGLSPCNT